MVPIRSALPSLRCKFPGRKTPTTPIIPRTKTITTRGFHNKAEFQEWRQQVLDSRLSLADDDACDFHQVDLKTEAPFLYSVEPIENRLKLYAVTNALPGSPQESMLECRYPLASDELLRNSITDFSNWSSFRLGKFYEAVDSLTADVAYRHCNGDDENSNDTNGEVTLVTAGHYHSRKFESTMIHHDVFLRSYVTSVGRSSMEVRTDALQRRPTETTSRLLNVCHTIMVALDSKTMKPLSKSGRSIRPLQIAENDPTSQLRLHLANRHQEIRQERSRQAMQLRLPVSEPPSPDEMRQIHHLHQTETIESEQLSSSSVERPSVSDFTFQSSSVIFPEHRNVHGKLFGGFVMTEAQNLAQYTASLFAEGRPIANFGIDDAIFLQPIAIGDLVTFTSHLVHSTGTTCRVLVTVEVRDPKNRHRRPRRSNRLVFVFGGADLPSNIIPYRYDEILMHIDAQRRHNVEGPFDDEVNRILAEAENEICWIDRT